MRGWRENLEYLQGNYDPGYAQQYRQGVLEGDYLDLESNPYFQQRADEVQRRLGEQNAMGMTQAASPFALGSGGMEGGAAMAQQALMQERGTQAMSEGMNNLYLQQYQQERQAQQEMAQMESQLTQQYVAAGASMEQAQRQARAQVQSARIQAEAQKAAAAMSLQASLANTQLGRENMRWGQQMDMYGMAQNQDAFANQQAMLPYQQTQDMFGMVMPMNTSFGQQNSTQTTRGPRYNPSQAGLAGGFGGALQGLGMAGQLGGFGGRGGGGNSGGWPSPMPMPTPYSPPVNTFQPGWGVRAPG
jgi:hypothetical protein